ncbi:MAG: alkaline phosphatase family protein [Oculatellaceae cyanobacterium bins.114]|nr:alkaline phosphatase family protein [Oculatellaceae cyanobacterium bins.114]
MKRPVIAIGIDTVHPELLEAWMAQGHLKNLNALRSQGTYGPLTYGSSPEEMQWTSFLTGCSPEKTGYWGRLGFNQTTYDVAEEGVYNFEQHPPFYALGEDYKVAVLRTPQIPMSDNVNGPQVGRRRSRPPELLNQLYEQYGKLPVYKEYGCFWDKNNLRYLHKTVHAGIKRQLAMCRDMLRQDQWDLFLTVIDEAHYASHDFWYISQPDHPLHPYRPTDVFEGDPLLEVYEAIDQAIGEIIAQAPDDAYVMVFSVDGMGANSTDIPTMVFLPEFLYRYNFPGQFALAKGNPNTPPPPPVSKPKRQSWAGEVWQRRYDSNPLKRWIRQWLPGKFQDKLDQLWTSSQPSLVSPYQLLKQYPSLFWQPTLWYRPLWSTMKAFALPNFSDGHVRINVKGREAHGMVDPADYAQICEDLTAKLYQLKDARTGEPMVLRVVRTRETAMETKPGSVTADLIVEWRDRPIDVVDSPEFGRIGPIPYCNTGGHKPVGFLMTKGPGIEANATLPQPGRLTDLAPTILTLLDAPIPDYCEGSSLLHPQNSGTVSIS